MPKEKELFRIMKVTDSQLKAIVNAADTLSGMVGVGSDFDDDAKDTVKKIDQFLKCNGMKRKHK